MNRPDYDRLRLAAAKKTKERQYWLESLAGDLPRSSFYSDLLPAQSLPTAAGTAELGIIEFEFGEMLSAQLKKLSAASDARLFIVLTALVTLLLSKHSGNEDILIGAPVFCPGKTGTFEQHTDDPGSLINTIVVLRNQVYPGMTFKDFLLQARQSVIAAEENRGYPFEILWEQLGWECAPFDIAILLENIHDKRYLDRLVPALRVLFSFRQPGDSVSCLVTYAAACYSHAAIERITRRLIHLSEQVLGDIEKKTSELEIILPEEKEQVLYDFNKIGTGYPLDKTIHGLFEEQAGKNPDRIALVDPASGQLSYRQLDYGAGYLAAQLKEKGVQPGTIVALICERSMEMIAAIFSILKAGGAYLPIDRVYPPERVDYILKDSCAQEVLSDQDIHWASRHQGYTGSVHDVPITGNVNSANLAYIIYTSGTTGKPKGALITHQNVVRLMFNDAFQFDFGSGDIWTMFHTYCFDFSVWEMYGALLYGGRLIIVPRSLTLDPVRYLDLLKIGNVTVLNQTPSVFYNLIDEELKAPNQALHLKYVIFGGEALRPGKLKQWSEKYPAAHLINMYGITETTVHVTYKEVTSFEIEHNFSNIGRPIPTLQTYVMNHDLLVPTGTPGELIVGGAGVGRGYLNRPELTADKFIKQKSSTLYRSGDLVRQLPNGELEYLGRIDHQVKIRGFRVELGEIENRLLSHEAIKEAVVLDKVGETGENYLCAYIVTTGQGQAEDDKSMMRSGLQGEIREYLAMTLPDYMIPTYFIPLEKIPINPNGKVDRKALPAPMAGIVSTGQDYVAPKTRTEMLVAEAWKEVLKLEQVSIHDNYFEVGGNSFNIVQVYYKLIAVFPVNLQMMTMFRYPTIRELAHVLDQQGQGSDEAPDRKQRAEALARGKRDRSQRLEKRKQGLDKMAAGRRSQK